MPPCFGSLSSPNFSTLWLPVNQGRIYSYPTWCSGSLVRLRSGSLSPRFFYALAPCHRRSSRQALVFDIEIYDLAPFHRAISDAIDALAPFHPLVCHRFGSPPEAISLPFGSPPSPDAWLAARNSHVHSPFLPFFLPFILLLSLGTCANVKNSNRSRDN